MPNQSKIIETNNITDIIQHVDDKTLAIFDIDNTLIDPVQDFGGYKWSIHLTKRFTAKGFDFDYALDRSYQLYDVVRKLVNFKAVETNTSEVIKKVQAGCHKSMALTARAFYMGDGTHENLVSAGMEFAQSTIHGEPVKFTETAGFLNGILFSGLKMKKGECITKFLDMINYTPERVLFVDDARHYIENIYDTFSGKNIPITCVRYGATDEREAAFDPARSDRELIQMIGHERFKEIFEEIL